jgi:uncharacterized membrane protein (DUF2068 family)
MERPTSVTIISWILIVLGALGVLVAALMSNNPDVMEQMAKSKLGAGNQQIIGIVSSVVSIVSGYGMLQGKNWGRLLYVISTVIGIALNFYAMPMGGAEYLAIAIFVVVLFFLYRPAANAWFNRAGATA